MKKRKNPELFARRSDAVGGLPVRPLRFTDSELVVIDEEKMSDVVRMIWHRAIRAKWDELPRGKANELVGVAKKLDAEAFREYGIRVGVATVATPDQILDAYTRLRGCLADYARARLHGFSHAPVMEAGLADPYGFRYYPDVRRRGIPHAKIMKVVDAVTLAAVAPRWLERMDTVRGVFRVWEALGGEGAVPGDVLEFNERGYEMFDELHSNFTFDEVER